MRYCLDKKNKAMTLDKFLDRAEKGRISMSKLSALQFGGDRKHFTDGRTASKRYRAKVQ